MKRKTKSKKLAILVLLVAFLLLGMIWQYAMAHIERETYTAIGEYADLEAYQR